MSEPPMQTSMRVVHAMSPEQEQTLESCLVQLVELKPLRVNERSAPGERDDDDAENGSG